MSKVGINLVDNLGGSKKTPTLQKWGIFRNPIENTSSRVQDEKGEKHSSEVEKPLRHGEQAKTVQETAQVRKKSTFRGGEMEKKKADNKRAQSIFRRRNTKRKNMISERHTLRTKPRQGGNDII